MKKKILCFVLLAVLVMGLTTNAYAKESSITFNGSETLENNIDTESFNNTFKNMVPGSSRSEEIVLKNTSEKTCDFYMETEVLKTFEEIANIKKGVYQVELKVDSKNGTEIIFGKDGRAAAIGGKDEENLNKNGSNQNLSGLGLLNGSLDDSILVATLDKGDEATVTFTIAIEGESMENEYNAAKQAFEELVGTIQFEFFAMIHEFNAPVQKNFITKFFNDIIQTGDIAPLTPLIIILVAALGVVVVVTIVKGRKKDE